MPGCLYAPASEFPSRSRAATPFAGFLLILVLSLAASRPALAQGFQVIHSFTGAGDGAYPLAGLTLDATGNLYGTSSSLLNLESCPTGCLVVYELSPDGEGWNFATLFTGQNASQGSTPASSMVWRPGGALYGTTMYGGTGSGCASGFGCGVIFKLTETNGNWTESEVYPFTGLPNGNFPKGELAFDSAGNLYGTTSGGGSTVGCPGGGCLGNGVVYELALASGTPAESVLYTFGATRVNDGIAPAGGVVIDSAGNLYGTTLQGGDLDYGTVFELAPDGSNWAETILYSFTGGDNGVWPAGGVILDAGGNLYGSTEYNYQAGGGGTLFELSPSGNRWVHDVLYDFPSPSCGTPPCHLGAGPVSNLIMDRSGNLYGTTSVDGQYGCGSVFKLARSGEGWSYSSLHEFSCGIDGANPSGSLVMDSLGNLYGTTTGGGLTDYYCNSGCGVVFEIMP